MSSDRTLRRKALEASRNQQFLCESESDISDFWNPSESENGEISDSHCSEGDIQQEGYSNETQETQENSQFSPLSSVSDEYESSEVSSRYTSSVSDVSTISSFGSEMDGDDDSSLNPPELPIDQQPLSLNNSIAIWQVTNHIAQSHCDELLKILKPHHPELPLSTKALVGTPRSIEIPEMAPGLYFHHGLETGIRQALFPFKLEEVRENLSIHLATDGVSLTNSSTSQFWPIVGFIPALQNSAPFEVGMYWGMSKPGDSNLFLQRTIDEADELFRNGMVWLGRRTRVKVDAFVCDAPARAGITRTKSHSSKKNGCSKCNGSGTTLGILRTDFAFRNKTDALHHHGYSVIENLEYFNCVDDVPLDAMHLCDLGIMKRMMEYLFRPEKTNSIPNVTLNPATIRAFNSSLLAIRPFISRFDFARQPRKNVKDIPRFKATEFRLFLHYIGVILFKQLSGPVYRHFLLFHVAIRLLSCRPWCVDDNAYAHKLLCTFVKNAPAIYSDSFVCYNLHSLFHIANDVLNHGPLYSYSAYRFENFYGFLKKFLKKTHKPLHQLVKRLAERNKLNHLISQYENRKSPGSIVFSNRHRAGPVVMNCTGLQYRKAVRTGFWTLQSKEPDNCVFLTDLTVVQISNFVNHKGTNVMIGRRFRVKRDVYKSPLPSSCIHEYLVSNLSPQLQAWDMNNIKCKAVKIPASTPNHEPSFVVFPLLMQ